MAPWLGLNFRPSRTLQQESPLHAVQDFQSPLFMKNWSPLYERRAPKNPTRHISQGNKTLSVENRFVLTYFAISIVGGFLSMVLICRKQQIQMKMVSTLI